MNPIQNLSASQDKSADKWPPMNNEFGRRNEKVEALAENEKLRKNLNELKGKLNGYQEEGSELIQFNKELQWTLMAMKKDND